MILIIYGKRKPPKDSDMIVSVIDLLKFNVGHLETMHCLVNRTGIEMQTPGEVVAITELTLEEVRVKILMSGIPAKNEKYKPDEAYTFTTKAVWMSVFQGRMRQIAEENLLNTQRRIGNRTDNVPETFTASKKLAAALDATTMPSED